MGNSRLTWHQCSPATNGNRRCAHPSMRLLRCLYQSAIVMFALFATACSGQLSASAAAENGQPGNRQLVISGEMRLAVEDYANSIAWSPDSRYLAASDQRGHHLYVWDATTGSLVFRVPNTAA